ncbi:B12 binding protein [Pseudonocardia sediminis]|uniref:B12 binding protein n=1 Tax=Pseudonocardia sediminis TaxID=1397368 RepID=A0A4Q7V1E1_PSEST|nr:MerR family transcriptional regulator [Pseudonocardia sediminis]RZT87274.1 B12 binding protein [Pseudonocardia sediminis]
MTTTAGETEQPGPLWSTAAVARRMGVSPATLRSWSRRYGIGPAGHDPGRHRRYTATDVAELDAIRSLVDSGVVLTAAAELVRSQRRTGPPAAAVVRPAAAASPVAALVAAAVRLDSVAATEIVTAGLDERGVLATWEQLGLPALDGLDPLVADDGGCADSQLLLSWVLATCLRRLGAPPDAPGDRPVLLACAADEHHTLGFDVLHAALAERRVPVRMLGATVPDTALLHAAARLRPSAVAVWSQRPDTARSEQVSGLTEHTDVVLAAGPGWSAVTLPGTVTRVDDLRAALALVSAVTTPVPA